jgi:MYXO-CTERM domain-containing protein
VGGYCITGATCAKTKGDGVMCSQARECQSGFCIDGVCCESACNAECGACNQPGNEGECVAIPGAESCAPYYCNVTNGSCPDSCNTDHECTTGYVCDADTKTCQKHASSKDSGCGCRAVRPDGKSLPFAILASAGVLLLGRRRKILRDRSKSFCGVSEGR